MENGPKPKNGKKLAKKKKWPSARNGKRWPKMAKKWDLGSSFYFFHRSFFYFFHHFWAIFSSSRAEGHFGQFFPIFGFRPVFHSIPGGLTRNTRRILGARCFQNGHFGRISSTLFSTVFQRLGGRASTRRVSHFRQAHCFVQGPLRFLRVPRNPTCPLPHLGVSDDSFSRKPFSGLKRTGQSET